MISLRVARAALAALTVAACTHGGSAANSPSPPAGSPSRPAGGPAAAMERYLGQLTAAGRFSGAVLVARHGHVIFSGGYGLADRAAGTPDRPQTIFQIGSVTKQFTAMAIAMLADSGRLRLAGRACDYLPGCPASWRPVTIAELLTHTAGIADWASWRLSGPLPGELTDPIPAIVSYAERQPLAFRPGSRASYSNPGYVVLGDIIQRVSGMSYPAFLRTRIFVPLGMSSTGVYAGQAPGPGHALGYLAGGTVAPAGLTAASSAAGAIYSTVGDLFRWDQALITGTPRLVTPSALRQILTVHAACPRGSCPFRGDRGYGYGWFVGADRGGTLVHHSGSVLGFWSYNGFYPQSQTVVVILANLDTVQIDPISQELNALATGPGPPQPEQAGPTPPAGASPGGGA